jgi:hypothetical protein
MALEITHQDDTPLSGLTLIAERGVPSDIVDLKIKNTGVTDIVGAFLTLYAETAPGSGIYVPFGQPAVDERQGRFQITGQDTLSTAGQEVVLDVVQPMGHLASAHLPPIKPGDWILADFWIQQGTNSAGGGAITLKIEVANDRAASPLPVGVSWVGSGIATGLKQGRSILLTGRATLANGPADDGITVDPGTWLINGEEYAETVADPLTLDQDDGAAAALVGGESYIAAITQGTDLAPNITKGLKDLVPIKPTPPVGELILAWVTVVYNATASVINQSDIESDITYGRYLVVNPGSGLSVIVHAGEAIINDFAQIRAIKGSVLLVASSENRIWLQWDGSIVVTQTDAIPSAGAIKIAFAVTDGTDVTSLTDTRRYIHSGRLRNETPVGVQDSVNVDFTINDDEDGMLVKSSAVMVEPEDFTRVGRTITFVTPPSGGDVLRWFHIG